MARLSSGLALACAATFGILLLGGCEKQDSSPLTRDGLTALAAKDFGKARTLFKQSCDGGDLAGCFNLANMAREAQGAPQDMHLAIPLYQRACDGNVVMACYYLGVAKEEIAPVDMAAAQADYAKACDGGAAQGCLALGIVVRDKTNPDLPGARTAFAKACDLKNDDACAMLAPMLFKGQGGAKDLPKARALFIHLCDADHGKSCLAVGLMLHQGDGGPVDMPGARKALSTGCDSGDADACNFYGMMLNSGEGGPRDTDLAQACMQKDPVRCGKYGTSGIAVGTPDATGDAAENAAPAAPAAPATPDADAMAAPAAPDTAMAAPESAPAAPESAPAAAPRMFQPSFDCADAHNTAMRLICTDESLARDDVELASLYRRARRNAVDPRMVDTEQNEWASDQRDACKTASCLRAAYASRRKELREWLGIY